MKKIMFCKELCATVVGSRVGFADGKTVGNKDGKCEGRWDGFADTRSEGDVVGTAVDCEPLLVFSITT